MSILPQARRNQGFTMIELIVTFSLLAVVTGIGFFSFLDFSQLQEVDQGAKDVASFVERGRANASSFVKPEECGSGNLEGYRIDYCGNPDSDCEGEGDYELSVLCGGGQIVIDSLTLSEPVTHDESSSCTSVVYRVPQGTVEGVLPCTQILDRSGRQEFVTINPQGHVLFGEDGQTAAGNTPTPGGSTPTAGGPTFTPTPTVATPTPTTSLCAPTELYIHWDKGGTPNISMCRRTNGLLSYHSGAACQSPNTPVRWQAATQGTLIRTCLNPYTGQVVYSLSGNCGGTYQPYNWMSGTGSGQQIQACASYYTGAIRMLSW